MARRKARILTEVELEFMHVVWDGQEVTTEDVRGALARKERRLSDGSVRKMLSILVAKGYLSRRPKGRGFLYRATVPRERAGRRMVSDLVKRAFGGSAALMVAALLDSNVAGEREIRRIKKLLDEREREKAK